MQLRNLINIYSTIDFGLMTQRKNRTWIQILTFINEDSNQPAFILYINWTQIIYGKKLIKILITKIRMDT